MSGGFNSAVLQLPPCSPIRQPVSSAMSNTSIKDIYYKMQIFRKHISTSDLPFINTDTFNGFVFKREDENACECDRYCTCACTQDTEAVLKKLSETSL